MIYNQIRHDLHLLIPIFAEMNETQIHSFERKFTSLWIILQQYKQQNSLLADHQPNFKTFASNTVGIQDRRIIPDLESLLIFFLDKLGVSKAQIPFSKFFLLWKDLPVSYWFIINQLWQILAVDI
jgi:hypothetical protein